MSIISVLFIVFGYLCYCHSFSIHGFLFYDPLYLANQPTPFQSLGGSRSERSDKRLCTSGSAFHNETGTCQKFLERGPCGNLQLFYSVSRDPEASSYGTCACMTNPDGCDTTVTNNRMILPGSDSKQCYWAYTQGPCQFGKWYILDMVSRKPKCQPNPCSNEEHKVNQEILRRPRQQCDVFTFERNGTCFRTFSQGFCPDGEYVQFVGSVSPNPKCFPVNTGPKCGFLGIHSVTTSAGLPCEAGYKLVGDDCHPIADFE